MAEQLVRNLQQGATLYLPFQYNLRIKTSINGLHLSSEVALLGGHSSDPRSQFILCRCSECQSNLQDYAGIKSLVKLNSLFSLHSNQFVGFARDVDSISNEIQIMAGPTGALPMKTFLQRGGQLAGGYDLVSSCIHIFDWSAPGLGSWELARVIDFSPATGYHTAEVLETHHQLQVHALTTFLHMHPNIPPPSPGSPVHSRPMIASPTCYQQILAELGPPTSLVSQSILERPIASKPLKKSPKRVAKSENVEGTAGKGHMRQETEPTQPGVTDREVKSDPSMSAVNVGSSCVEAPYVRGTLVGGVNNLGVGIVPNRTGITSTGATTLTTSPSLVSPSPIVPLVNPVNVTGPSGIVPGTTGRPFAGALRPAMVAPSLDLAAARPVVLGVNPAGVPTPMSAPSPAANVVNAPSLKPTHDLGIHVTIPRTESSHITRLDMATPLATVTATTVTATGGIKPVVGISPISGGSTAARGASPKPVPVLVTPTNVTATGGAKPVAGMGPMSGGSTAVGGASPKPVPVLLTPANVTATGITDAVSMPRTGTNAASNPSEGTMLSIRPDVQGNLPNVTATGISNSTTEVTATKTANSTGAEPVRKRRLDMLARLGNEPQRRDLLAQVTRAHKAVQEELNKVLGVKSHPLLLATLKPMTLDALCSWYWNLFGLCERDDFEGLLTSFQVTLRPGHS